MGRWIGSGQEKNEEVWVDRQVSILKDSTRRRMGRRAMAMNWYNMAQDGRARLKNGDVIEAKLLTIQVELLLSQAP